MPYSIYKVETLPANPRNWTQIQIELNHQMTRHPKARISGGYAIFASSYPRPIEYDENGDVIPDPNPVYNVEDMLRRLEGEDELTEDEVFLKIAKQMFKASRLPIEIDPANTHKFDRHPVWRVMINEYADDDATTAKQKYRDDHALITRALPDINLDPLPAQDRNIRPEAITNKIITELVRIAPAQIAQVKK